MSIETDLYSTLSGNGGISAIVGTKIYPLVVPESVANPCMSYTVVAETRVDTIKGSTDGRRSMIQIACHAGTYSGSKTLAEAVYSALDGNGYLESALDLYDATTQTYTVAITWRFMATS